MVVPCPDSPVGNKGIYELVHLRRNDILELETQLLLGQGLTSLVRSVSARHSATTLAGPPLRRNPEEALNQVRGHTGFAYLPPLASFECLLCLQTLSLQRLSLLGLKSPLKCQSPSPDPRGNNAKFSSLLITEQ